MSKIQCGKTRSSKIRIDRGTVNSLPILYQALAEVLSTYDQIEILETVQGDRE